MSGSAAEQNRFPYSNASRAVNDLMGDVNRAGGVCGRLIDLVRGGPETAPPDDTLAMLFTPQNSYLDEFIENGTAARLGIPIVGTDGLTETQFGSPLVWPVGLPVASLTRIAVDHAYRQLGARSFALVHDDTRSGQAAASAFPAYIASLPGASVRVVHSVQEPTERFNDACGNDACDVVVWAMDPGWMNAWINAKPARGRLQTAALLYGDFHALISQCRGSAADNQCANLHAWIGFTPPVAGFLGNPDVRAYRGTAGSVNAWDEDALVEGAYVGAKLLLEAIHRTGPEPTRAGLQRTLQEMRYESALTAPLAWDSPGRVANHAARAVRMDRYNWVGAGTGWVNDPTPGVFPQ